MTPSIKKLAAAIALLSTSAYAVPNIISIFLLNR